MTRLDAKSSCADKRSLSALELLPTSCNDALISSSAFADALERTDDDERADAAAIHVASLARLSLRSSLLNSFCLMFFIEPKNRSAVEYVLMRSDVVRANLLAAVDAAANESSATADARRSSSTRSGVVGRLLSPNMSITVRISCAARTNRPSAMPRIVVTSLSAVAVCSSSIIFCKYSRSRPKSCTLCINSSVVMSVPAPRCDRFLRLSKPSLIALSAAAASKRRDASSALAALGVSAGGAGAGS